MGYIIKLIGISVLTLAASSLELYGQNSVLGLWKTIDDKTGKAKSIVELTAKNGQLEGRVVDLFLLPEEDKNPLCDECEGELKDKPIRGMQIISGLTFNKQNQKWEGGEILDPENGTTYDCKIWLEGRQLKVRGYVAFFFRTQTWTRIKE